MSWLRLRCLGLAYWLARVRWLRTANFVYALSNGRRNWFVS